jgi:uncharacterized metal-binding protein YceD (DUF177 family)
VLGVFKVVTRPLLKEPVGATLPVALVGGAVGDEGVVSSARGTVTKLERGYLVNLDVAWRASGLCDRCLEPVTWESHGTIEETFGREAGEETRPLEDETIDLEPVLEELMFLERPAKILCRADCRGLCPHCGANRNLHDCDCSDDEVDPRFLPLLRWKKEE